MGRGFQLRFRKKMGKFLLNLTTIRFFWMFLTVKLVAIFAVKVAAMFTNMIFKPLTMYIV